jgi:hypothetical protein
VANLTTILQLRTLLAPLLLSVASAFAADQAADDLIGKMLASHATRGAVIRAKLSVEDSSSAHRTAAQIRIRLRRDSNVTHLLYQVLWPESHKGEAVSLERTADGEISGFIYSPPEKVTTINASTLQNACLDSDLTVEDLAESFLLWPSQRITGEEMMGGELCKIIESRPPPGAKSAYTLVRSWISPEKLLPLRIDKTVGEERSTKRFIVQKTARFEGVWVPVITVVQGTEKSRQTVLEISRGDRDVEISAKEFTLESIKGLTPPAPRN